jgi:sec-independent protein translocase protein TatB
MFDIGWSELLVVAVVTVIFIGPRELPKMLMAVGRWTAKARAVAREFQSGLEDMAREAEMEDVKKSVESAARIDLGINPHNILDSTGKPGDISGPAASAPAAAAPEAVPVTGLEAVPVTGHEAVPVTGHEAQPATEAAPAVASAARPLPAVAPAAVPAVEPPPPQQRTGS